MQPGWNAVSAGPQEIPAWKEKHDSPGKHLRDVHTNLVSFLILVHGIHYHTVTDAIVCHAAGSH